MSVINCIISTYRRLILIAEKDTVYEKFPTPLINRMEKHFVLTSSVLKEWQEIVLKKLEDWIQKFSDARYKLCMQLDLCDNLKWRVLLLYHEQGF